MPAYLKIKTKHIKKKWEWEGQGTCSSRAEHLLCMCETLRLIPGTTITKNNEQNILWGWGCNPEVQHLPCLHEGLGLIPSTREGG